MSPFRSAALTCFLTLAASACAQENELISKKLLADLDTRIAEFTQAQQVGDWTKVGEMFGPVLISGERYLITPAIRACLVEQQKLAPLLTFKRSDGFGFSSEIYELPREKRFYWFHGTGNRKVGENYQQIDTGFTAFRDDGQWYFKPSNLDARWAALHTDQSEYNKDHASEIVIDGPTDSPVAIMDLHAFTSRSDPSAWTVTFLISNHSGKRVHSIDRVETLGYRDGTSEPYGEVMGENEMAAPDSEKREEMSFSPHPFACSPEVRTLHMFIPSVNFEDGTSWYAPGVKPPPPIDLNSPLPLPDPADYKPKDLTPRPPKQ